MNFKKRDFDNQRRVYDVESWLRFRFRPGVMPDSRAKRASFLYIYIKMQLVPAFLAYPFLTNHLLFESLVPLARYSRL